MVCGKEVTYTRSGISGQPIVINAVGSTPLSGIIHEAQERSIINGRFDYAVAMRMLTLGEDALSEILRDIVGWLETKNEEEKK